MPAKRLQPATEEGTYRHVYNKGVENRIIFGDESDYRVFLDYLEEYLSPQNLEASKKDFSIKGRVFKGVPHQPKNYFKKIELITYSLEPSHFHLVLQEIKQKSLQAFMRSLSTRYSIYFNKKYARRGSLFVGPYRSVVITDKTDLSHLAHYFHKQSQYSSYPQYLGQVATPAVSPKVIQSIINNEENYQDFIAKHQPNNEEKALLSKIVLEDLNMHLVRRNLAATKPKHSYRIPELIGAGTIFVLLLVLGVKNITATAQIPATLGTKTQLSTPSASPTTAPAATAEAKPHQ